MRPEADVSRKSPTEIRDVFDELRPNTKRGYWVAQRVGWVVIAAIVLLAFAGLFGTGLFSQASTSASDDGVDVKLSYQRFLRRERPHEITIEVKAPAQSGPLQVAVPSGFSQAIAIEGMTPEPDSVSFTPDGPTFEWPVTDWTEPVRVKIRYKAEEWMRISGGVLVTAGEAEPLPLEFTMWVSP
jgi:hypothetical protein